MRTTDVGRRTGYSAQQIRNLERDGVLPPAARTATGYRVYDSRHVQSALAYRALAAGTGPTTAKHIVRAAHEQSPARALALLDAAHAALDTERHEVRLAREAASAIAAEPMTTVRPTDSLTITELAAALGVRPSTLRHWEAEGLVVSSTRPRQYTPAQVQDARIVHQLRLAGYRITPLKALLPQLRAANSTELAKALSTRDTTITTKSLALTQGTAALTPLLNNPQQRTPS